MDMNDFKLDEKNRIATGFKVPDHYFDAFPEKAIQRLPSAGPKVVPLWERNKKWMYAVAAVVVLSLSLPVMNYFKTDPEQAYADEVENYLTHHSTLSDDDIIELLSEEDVKAIPLNSNLKSSELEDALKDNANLEEYLID